MSRRAREIRLLLTLEYPCRDLPCRSDDRLIREAYRCPITKIVSAERIRYQDVVQNRGTSFHFLVQARSPPSQHSFLHTRQLAGVYRVHARLRDLSIWAGHVHEHAPRRISALFAERKSVNDRGSPSGCAAGDRSRFSGDDLPAEEIPSTRRGRDMSGYADIHRSGGTSTRVAGAAG